MFLIKRSFILKIFLSIFCLLIYCEYFIYYFVLYECTWPKLDKNTEDDSIKQTDEEPVKAMVIADTHLLGSRKGHWLDKLRREWQMHRAFQTAINLLQPELVFVLGDLTDEGLFASYDEFRSYVKRFYQLFAVPDNIQLHVVLGNHDIGFHYEISPYRHNIFAEAFNASSVKIFTVRNNHFVLLNSMALEGDGCFLCKPAEKELTKIEKLLKCSKNPHIPSCNSISKLKVFSKPILMQHYPLFRTSDMDCEDFDAAPFPIKQERFREKWECLGREATRQILHQITPRLVLSGHTHHGCTRKLAFGDGVEITIPSFSWRNKNNPTIGLGVFAPNNFAFSKCSIPQESTVINLYLVGVLIISTWIFYTFYHKRKRYFYR